MPETNQSENILEVNMRSRTKVYYKGEIKSLTTFNDKGELDVLPMHTNFISIISKYVVLNKGLKDAQRFDIESAVLSVQNGQIDIYVGV